jgi:hypothetical protein
MENRGSTDRAEPEYELRSLVPDPNVFSGGANDPERRAKTGQRGKDAAGSLLAGEAVADAYPAGFALNLNAQLSAGAGGSSGWH